ncbi:TPA: RusA family crossover junction endodeoxyribonuclease [Neisseria subflava]
MGWELAVLIPIEQIAEAAERANVLSLPYPISTNRYWKTFRNRQVLSKEAKAYKLCVSHAAERAGFRPSEKDVILFVSLVPKMNKDGTSSKVILDLDNCLKVAVDALQGVVYHNDNQVKFILSTYASEPRENGGLDVGIAEVLK